MASYPAIVEWDENAGAYGAVFPDLDIGAVGMTLEEVLENAKEMLRDYVMEMDNGDGRCQDRALRSRWRWRKGTHWP